jgi:hypothetical protein
MTARFIRAARGRPASCLPNKTGGHRPPLQQFSEMIDTEINDVVTKPC